ncbi:relaxase/mobilization nuclease domain-containing protein [Ferruginibacter sp.]
MILKSLSRKSDSTGQLVNYVMRYVFKEQEDAAQERIKPKEQQASFIIRHNLRSKTVLKNFIKEFQENEKYRLVKRKNSVKLFHTILSISNKDKSYVSDEMLKDLAQKFIELRGSNNLYLGTKHEEGVDHIHMHLIVSGTQLNGRSSRISKQKFHSIKLALQKYQQEKYPELIHSLPEHGKGKKIIKENLIEQVKANRQTDKLALLGSLEKIYASSKSKEHFLEQLKTAGHSVYLRNGRVQGVTFNEKKFRFSRLGFDDEKLHALDQKQSIPDNSLQLLQQLRDRNRTQDRRDIIKTEADTIKGTNSKNKTLDELFSIRENRASNEHLKDCINEELEREVNEQLPTIEEDVAVNDIDTSITRSIGKLIKPIALVTK